MEPVETTEQSTGQLIVFIQVYSFKSTNKLLDTYESEAVGIVSRPTGRLGHVV